jgi:hypothetical protein
MLQCNAMKMLNGVKHDMALHCRCFTSFSMTVLLSAPTA